MAALRKTKLAVWKFSSCDGCQLSLLDVEDELLEIAETVDIAYFLEASSRLKRGPYDISFIACSSNRPSGIMIHASPVPPTDLLGSLSARLDCP